MKKILAFGASNSKQSINGKLAIWAANQLEDVEINPIDLNDFEMPIYGIDKENESGIPDLAHAFKAKLNEADGVIISLAEHNGSYTAAFKNITDWVSRIEKGTWSNKPMLLLATSPGGRGGLSVLTSAKSSFPHQGANVTGSFSLPSFNQNFSEADGIVDTDLKDTFDNELNEFKKAVQ